MLGPGETAPANRPGYTAADVRFMRGMLVHHAQALVMTDLAEERAASESLRMVARRIEISQASEIGLMRRWLGDRGETVPPLDMSGHGGAGGHMHMPGMATDEELARLAAASGVTFDRLFLELMIRHHEGALVMVSELLGSAGAGQEPELFQLVSHVDADQRAEIARMQAMLSQFESDPLP
ncbi:MAG TPA: DUF305 domain-containing protein [Longimicrobiales bacterium]|nr:DUF305 domain-containing protein [Longimicrobiales bacterium]